MTTRPLIQKKLDEFDAFAPEDEKCSGDKCVNCQYSRYRNFLTTALQEALIAGLEMAEGAVPDEVEYTPLLKRIKINWMTSENRCWGFNHCRTKALSALAALKKEVMEGKKSV